ncbi:TPA: type II toxin-antitoxin system RelB/DinJ family antitoxin [Streptococcus pneumoniae]|nr:type II toxin-antitoxin system RelB/DinJ family antitoxin [Streptococcus pneumoniae]
MNDLGSKMSISIRLDSEVKEQAQQVFSNLGMDMTTAINIFLRQAIQYQGLPFDVRLDENRKLLQALTDLDQNRNMSQSFESVSDLMEDLRA